MVMNKIYTLPSGDTLDLTKVSFISALKWPKKTYAYGRWSGTMEFVAPYYTVSVVIDNCQGEISVNVCDRFEDHEAAYKVHTALMNAWKAVKG